MAQQLRETTPGGDGPRFLIPDNDDKRGTQFDDVANGTGITILRTPGQAPNANAVCERFLRNLRTECLHHVLVLSEGHVRSRLRDYYAYFNQTRPHQGIGHQVSSGPPACSTADGVAIGISVLGGLHHEYRRAA